ncbi:barstar family protein [Gordonia sp. NPDC003425]
MTAHHDRTPSPITLSRFLIGARRHGPAVGVWIEDTSPPQPAGFEVRTLDGTQMSTIAGLYDEYARGWDFPDYFGRNKDAFDDCMRDLDGTALSEGTRAPAGYLTVIDDADRLLAAAPGELRWFGRALGHYRDHYRDTAIPHATFATLLSAPPDRRRALESRWRDARVAVTVVAG